MTNLSQRIQLLDLKENQLFRNYKIISKDAENVKDGLANPLGEGGSGIVFLAEQTFIKEIKVKRAIKFFVFRDDIADKQKNRISLRNFNDEILNIASFNHENILKIIDGGYEIRKEEDIPFIVTDYVEGHPLDAFISSPEIMNEYIENGEDIINIFGQICTGLAYLHSKEFYHCDIAPKNIFIKGSKGNFQVIIGDLGVGKTLNKSKSDKSALFVHGSRRYMPQNVLLLNGKEIEYEKFIELQPNWDLHSLKITFTELINAVEQLKRPDGIWFKSLKKIVEREYKRVQDVARNIERLKPIYRQTAGIPELSEADSTLHGHYELHPIKSVWITDRIKKVIRHPMFFRLKKVPQLLSSNTFNPGSNHTRYEHALGTYENMRKVLMSLLRNEDFLDILDEDYIHLALISALLYSLPKFPFSFVIHEIRDRDSKYFNSFNSKDILLYLLNHKDEGSGISESLLEILKKQFGKIDIDSLVKIITSSSDNRWEKDEKVISKLLNSTIDVRVLDFLPRDSYHLGMSSGTHIDFDSLIANLCLHEGFFAIKSRGVTYVEQVVTLRYWLYKRIYWNSPNRAYTSVLKYIFTRAYLKDTTFEANLFQICFSSDSVQLFEFISKAVKDDIALSNLLKTIYSDRPVIFKEIFVINQGESMAELNNICNKLSKLPFNAMEKIRIELEKDLSKIFKFEADCINVLIDIPNEDNKKLGEDLTVIKYDGQPIPLKKVSGLIDGIVNTFDDNLKFLRIYLNPIYKDQLKKPKVREEVHLAINNFLRTLS